MKRRIIAIVGCIVVILATAVFIQVNRNNDKEIINYNEKEEIHVTYNTDEEMYLPCTYNDVEGYVFHYNAAIGEIDLYFPSVEAAYNYGATACPECWTENGPRKLVECWTENSPKKTVDIGLVYPVTFNRNNGLLEYHNTRICKISRNIIEEFHSIEEAAMSGVYPCEICW